nr:MAG TPA: hypothetical protein [Caudoviricetes sp.]
MIERRLGYTVECANKLRSWINLSIITNSCFIFYLI